MKTMLSRLVLLCLTFLLPALVGCAAVGAPTPQTFNQRAAVAQVTVTEVVRQTTLLLNAKKLTSAEAEDVKRKTDQANEGIALAVAMNANGNPAAGDRLQTAVVALTALQTYLASKGST